LYPIRIVASPVVRDDPGKYRTVPASVDTIDPSRAPPPSRQRRRFFR